MSKRDFIALVDGLKSTLGTITDDQRETLLRQARQNYGLTTDEATTILNDSGLVAGELVNYFEVLGITIEALKNHSEDEIQKIVDAKYGMYYNRASAMVSNPHITEKEIEEMKNRVIRAKTVLTNPEKRRKHIAELIQGSESAQFPMDEGTQPIFKFPNGDEATSIPQLTISMVKMQGTL